MAIRSIDFFSIPTEHADPETRDPFKSLWKGVIIQAIEDAAKHPHDLMAWIHSEDGRAVCELADVDREKVRSVICDRARQALAGQKVVKLPRIHARREFEKRVAA